jgi:hypothetical protein
VASREKGVVPNTGHSTTLTSALILRCVIKSCILTIQVGAGLPLPPIANKRNKRKKKRNKLENYINTHVIESRDTKRRLIVAEVLDLQETSVVFSFCKILF